MLLGDSCVDLYYQGTCERLSPEAPVPVLKVDEISQKEGMSSNIKNNLMAFNLNVDYFTNSEEIQKIRFIDKNTNYQLLRADLGENTTVEPFNINKLNLEKEYDAIVISDYCKGFLTHENASQIVQLFSARGIPIFVDTKKSDISCYSNCIVKINKVEYQNLNNQTPDCELIVTLGNMGSYYNQNLYTTNNVEVFDVCGAGDVFLASLVYKYLLTRDKPRSICYANLMASYSVTHPGNWIVEPNIPIENECEIVPVQTDFLETL